MVVKTKKEAPLNRGATNTACPNAVTHTNYNMVKKRKQQSGWQATT